MDQLSALLASRERDVIVGWTAVAVLALTAVETLLDGAFNWTFIALVVAVVVLTPAIVFRDRRAMPPWELIVLVLAPILWQALLGQTFRTEIPAYLAVAALALLVITELHQFTSVRMNRPFAIVLVVLTTLAVAGVWNALQWAADVFFETTFVLDGRSQDAINADVMFEFVSAGCAGIGAGVLFDLFVRSWDDDLSDRTYVPPDPKGDPTAGDDLASGTRDAPDSRTLRDRVSISPRRQRQASRGMQLLLVVILLGGLYARDLAVIANAAVMLAITFVPAILRREYDLAMDAGLVLWITAAVSLHALGSTGLYSQIPLFDRFTHALSATVVAAGGYAVFRAIHVYVERVYIPPKLMAAFILLFVFAAGVVWEILEFALDRSAAALGIQAVLIQYGIDDTIGDLLFNALGALVVTIWGTVYLTDLSESVADRAVAWFGTDGHPK
ncbi:hypothetical protein [Halapricum hydrolyticum]|uniref:DUF2238 domain-containing protein n=1 Tax=Halapricum hydrolyticum TaxID=2979991 RepID=A0AAE3LGT4_9EURY|nr:hypothetical protein [Halapricum hydrolyticum]MCU4717087.1 hypothetical protein [Halapricum hydrolyticum]MCU4726014.1 hypothetical protein [Halapricum hydrolyticum]